MAYSQLYDLWEGEIRLTGATVNERKEKEFHPLRKIKEGVKITTEEAEIQNRGWEGGGVGCLAQKYVLHEE